MTVGELIDKLSDYGDHLEVAITGPNEKRHDISKVTDSNLPEGIVVELVFDR
jgi:hypothetical protein